MLLNKLSSKINKPDYLTVIAQPCLQLMDYILVLYDRIQI